MSEELVGTQVTVPLLSGELVTGTVKEVRPNLGDAPLIRVDYVHPSRGHSTYGFWDVQDIERGAAT